VPGTGYVRLVLALALVVACQQTDTTPIKRELPVLHDAGQRPRHDPVDLDKRAVALDRLRDELAATKRVHTPLEAPAELTNAYVDLEFAYGFARLGKIDRANALVTTARTAIGSSAPDPVHAVLLAVFGARIDQAIAGLPETAPLPADVEAQLAKLDRVARYKVDRLREVSHVLVSTESIDAIGAWIKKQPEPGGAEFAATRGLAGDALGRELEQILDTADVGSEPERAARLSSTCDALFGLPPAHVPRLLKRVITLAAKLSPTSRTLVASHALVVAAWLGDAETATSLTPLLVELGTQDDVAVIERAVHALAALGKTRELGELLGRLEPLVDTKEPVAGIAIGGGWFAVGDPAHARRSIEDVSAKLGALARPLPTQLLITRTLGFAYSNAPLETAERELAPSVEQFSRVTDSYGTNSHYCRSVIEDTEGLVRGFIPLDVL
jgi:hypothetical protein